MSPDTARLHLCPPPRLGAPVGEFSQLLAKALREGLPPPDLCASRPNDESAALAVLDDAIRARREPRRMRGAAVSVGVTAVAITKEQSPTGGRRRAHTSTEEPR